MTKYLGKLFASHVAANNQMFIMDQTEENKKKSLHHVSDKE